MSRLIKSSIFIFVLGCINIAAAQETINARIVPAKDKILIGDPVQIEISVNHRAGEKYELKIDERGLGFLELRGQSNMETRLIDGQSAETRTTLTVAPFATGKIPVPPFIIARTSDGAQLRTPPLEIEVEPVAAQSDRQIKDVRILRNPPSNGWVQAAALTILLASAGLYLFLRFADKRIDALAAALIGYFAPKKPAAPLAPAAPLQSLEDETIARLRLLLASGLASSDIKRFHVQLADIMIGYAAARYSVQDRECTTAELMDLLEGMGVPVLVTSAFSQILSGCDLVKFALARPDASEAERGARQAIDLFKALNFNVSNSSPQNAQRQ